MSKNILIFIPNNFSSENSGFIRGFRKDHANFEAYYITDHRLFRDPGKNCIGYVGKFSGDLLPDNTIFIRLGTKNISINKENAPTYHLTEIIYDYGAFVNSNIVCCDNKDKYGTLVAELTSSLFQKEQTNGNRLGIFYWLILVVTFIVKILAKVKPIIKNCATLTHCQADFETFSWFLINRQERKISPKHINICFAKLIDLALGIALIYLCLKHECDIISQLHYISKDFVSHLRQLLIYLMGSPIGLKLNYAFNRSLGKFFFYHINLWRVFLQAMEPLLLTHFKLLLLPALFGASYQIALLCDLISLATFHVYCIYVYAARLFSLQIKGLVSLWRLFIGRKNNPLRNRVDSCEYSSNQLFIGTLGFTVLLFLLPTTAMYYMVFAAFRLVILVIYTLFSKIKDILSSIPLYIVLLWIVRSSSISGALLMHWLDNTNESTRIELKLAPLSIGEALKTFSAKTEATPQTKQGIGTTIRYLCTGKLI